MLTVCFLQVINTSLRERAEVESAQVGQSASSWSGRQIIHYQSCRADLSSFHATLVDHSAMVYNKDNLKLVVVIKY